MIECITNKMINLKVNNPQDYYIEVLEKGYPEALLDLIKDIINFKISHEGVEKVLKEIENSLEFE